MTYHTEATVNTKAIIFGAIVPALALAFSTQPAVTEGDRISMAPEQPLSTISVPGLPPTWRAPCAVICDEICPDKQPGHIIDLSGNPSRSVEPGEDHSGECWNTAFLPPGGTTQCDWHSPECEGSEEQEEELAALWADLISGVSVNELALRISRGEGGIHFVPSRQAIQAAGCDGEIVANLPLGSAQAAALELALKSLKP